MEVAIRGGRARSSKRKGYVDGSELKRLGTTPGRFPVLCTVRL